MADPKNVAEALVLLNEKTREVDQAFAVADKATTENTQIKALVAEARALSEAGGMTFGPLQQVDFFAKLDALLSPAKDEAQGELKEVQV